jgi:signal transduction histidine kinase
MCSRLDKPSPTGSSDRSSTVDALPRASSPLDQLRWPLMVFGSSLRLKFMLLIVSLHVIVMGAVTLIVERHLRQAIIEQTRLRAVSLGESLATLSEGPLLGYNFAQLEQVAERLTSHDPDVIYTVTHVHDGSVAAFSGRSDLQGKILDDPVSQRALQAATPLVQEILIPGDHQPGYDVAIPVIVPGSAKTWGVIRLGFSLQRASKLLQQTRRDLLLLGVGAVLCSSSLAIVLALRITRPIGHLVEAAQELAQGTYDHPVRVNTNDEIGYLAHAFEQMRTALQRHMASQVEETRRLAEANQQLRQAQQQLIQSERMAIVGKVAARVAHEVNNPLAIIKTAVRIMRNRRDSRSASAENLQMIEEEIGRIARIIQELQEFSRPTPKPELVQVNSIIQSLERLLAHNLREKQIVLNVRIEPGLPCVWISPDQLKQVILNMIRNAEDAMPRGGTLLIHTARQGAWVECRVSDTGCGIAEDHRERIFEPFFTTKRHGRGMGLGLSVSYGIISAANGRIEVESEVGRGSTFRLWLPVAPTTAGGTSDV